MPAPTTEPVRLSTAQLLAQASGRPAPTIPERPSSRAVALVAVGTGVLLALSAGLPGLGIVGPGTGPAAAAPVRGQVVAESGPDTLGLPSTGGGEVGTGTSGGSGASDPATTTTPPPGTSSRTSCTAPCSTGQQVSVRILPGPLTITDAPSVVVVATDGAGRGSARLSGVHVTDLRGAASGWTLSATVARVVDLAGAAVPGARVELAPSCTRTSGPLTLESADPSVVGVGGTASLCLVPVAAGGSLAGGMVSAYADLVVTGAPAGTLVRVVLETAVG